MRIMMACGLTLLVLAGCDAMPRAEKEAKEYCAKEGKEPLLLDKHRNGNALVGWSATIKMVCLDPARLVHTREDFGVDTYVDIDAKGAQVIAVTPNSIAEKAGIKRQDVLYEYGGHSISTAEELKTAVANTSSGEKIPIKLHREQSEVVAFAQF